MTNDMPQYFLLFCLFTVIAAVYYMRLYCSKFVPLYFIDSEKLAMRPFGLLLMLYPMIYISLCRTQESSLGVQGSFSKPETAFGDRSSQNPLRS